MIPKHLFHLWLSDRDESQLAKRCMETWPLLGCEVEHITLDNCDRSEPFVQQALAAGTLYGLVKANDFLRIKYLHEKGGLYLDNDIEVLRNFDDLFQHACFMGAEDSQFVNGAVLGSEAGNWLLGECLVQMRKIRGDGPESPASVSLGTLTRVLREHGWRGDARFEKDGVVVYPSSAFYPVHWTRPIGPEAKASGAYTIHHWNMSWNGTVSVVIPCYNYGHYLKETIESVLAQTYNDIEIIVVDDGSTDNTAEVVNSFPSVRYIKQQNRGLSAARNKGIGEAKGQFIQPLDADDKLAPSSIARCVELMDGADIVSPGQKEFGDANEFYRRTGVRMLLEDFLGGNQIHCASMFRRKGWEQVGGYDERMTDGFEDWDFWIRLVAAGYGRIRVIDEPLFFYRVHRDSMLRNMGLKQQTVKAYMREKYARLGIGAAKLASSP